MLTEIDITYLDRVSRRKLVLESMIHRTRAEENELHTINKYIEAFSIHQKEEMEEFENNTRHLADEEMPNETISLLRRIIQWIRN